MTANCLLGSNVLLYLQNPAAPKYTAAKTAVARILRGDQRLAVTAQPPNSTRGEPARHNVRLMATVLLDTNVLVCLDSPSSPQHWACQAAIERMIERGDTPALPAQVLYEFWCVVTRPAAANGLGWEAAEASRALAGFRQEPGILHDSPEVLDLWLDMVVAHDLKGKRVHDAHLLASMKADGVTRLLTFNAADFPAESGISVLTPDS